MTPPASRAELREQIVDALEEARELVREADSIEATADRENRELNRRERGRVRYIIGRSRALSEQAEEITEVLDEDDRRRRHRRRLGFDPRGATRRGRGGETLGAWLAGETRALAEGSGSGSYIVPDDLLGQVWDRLAASSVLLSSGVRVVETDRDVLRIPRLTADAAANWVAEGGTISPADPTIDELAATPRKIAALTVASNELIDDSDPSVLDVLTANHLRSLALKFDLGALEGSGTPPEIRGLKNVAGIGTVSMGTNGATPSNLDPWADAIGALGEANAEAGAIVMHPRTWKGLSKLKEQTSGNNKPLLQESTGSGGQGIARSIYGLPVFLTSQLSVTETQGTSNDASSSYVYDLSQVVVVRRREARVEVDRSRLFNSDQSEVRTVARLDVVVPNPAAVVRILGIRP
jgi:HK97 family phage major capsid protein